MEEKLMSKNSLTVLAQKLAEKTGISQQDAELFIRKMFDVVNEGLQADKQVKMKWLGTFKVTSVKDRESVDVNTGERIVIEGRDKISFTPDTILKEIINKPFAQFETVVVNDGVEFDEIDRKFEAEEQLAENQQMDEAEEIPEPLDGSETSEETSEATGISEISETSETSDTSEISDTSETSDVIDFLDESEAPSVSDKVVVIGESEPHYDASPEIITETIVEKSVKEMKDEDEAEPTLEPESTLEPTHEPTLEPTPEPEQISAPNSEPVVESACASDSETSEDSDSYDTFESTKKGVVIPRYLVIVACFIIVALIGGIGWFAFNYGKMAAQRDHLALQLDNFHQDNKAAKPTPAPLSQEEIMRKKAIEDSIRMAQASEAVKMAEADGKQADKKDSLLAAKQQKDAEAKKQAELNKRADAKKLAEAKKVAEAKKAAEAKKLQAEKAAAHASAKYDQDARVRTGAYRIVGVAEVVTAREGQTIEAISKRYFGPGMECYVEALNGSGKLKAGQKVKIPKLELKKKSRTP